MWHIEGENWEIGLTFDCHVAVDLKAVTYPHNGNLPVGVVLGDNDGVLVELDASGGPVYAVDCDVTEDHGLVGLHRVVFQLNRALRG